MPEVRNSELASRSSSSPPGLAHVRPVGHYRCRPIAGCRRGAGPAAASTQTAPAQRVCHPADALATTQNAIRAGTHIVPLHSPASPHALGYVFDGARINAYDVGGRKVWDKAAGPGQLFGGIDLDRDGVPDIGIARSRGTGKSCGASLVNVTWLEIYAGRSGELIASTTPMEDMCHTALNYASPALGR